jgi:NRPS condensation-like uncharacterized protein
MAKMGRPKVDNPKKNLIGLKMTDDEVKRLKAYAQAHDKTVSEVIQGALELQYKQSKKK